MTQTATGRQPRRSRVQQAPPSRQGPREPGRCAEFYETPAASCPSIGAQLSEGELLRYLVLFHQWTRTGPRTIEKFRSHVTEPATGGSRARR